MANGVKRKKIRRVRLFQPQWKGPIEGWTVKAAVRAEWRVAPELEADDLLQEGFLLFAKCRDYYTTGVGRQVVDAQHFMSLYMASFNNLVNTLATKRSRRKLVTLDFEEDSFVDARADMFGEADIRLLLEDAPTQRVRKAVKRLLADPDNRPVMFQWSTGKRETTNEYLCRLAGVLPEKNDLAGKIRQWLKGAEQ